MVEGYAKRRRHETHNYCQNGGATALNWKCKLWTGLTHALFDLQPWNFNTHMRLLMPFKLLHSDFWPLIFRSTTILNDMKNSKNRTPRGIFCKKTFYTCTLDLFPPFWAVWKTLKPVFLPACLNNLRETFYTQSIDHYLKSQVKRSLLAKWWRYSTQ